MTEQTSYARAKLAGAAETIWDDDQDRPMRERLWSAYLSSLSSLDAGWFPDADAQDEFSAIRAELSKYGEPIDGVASVPTTLWTMSDADADVLVRRILSLADRYCA